MTRLRISLAVACALASLALGGLITPAVAGAAPMAHPAPLSVFLHCESTGGGRFLCDAYPSGGESPFAFYWTMIRNAGITTNAGGTIFGRCTVGTIASVSVTVFDSHYSSASDTASFRCYSIAP